MLQNSMRLLRLAVHSRACLDDIVARTGTSLDFERSAIGTLQIASVQSNSLAAVIAASRPIQANGTKLYTHIHHLVIRRASC